MVVKWLLGLALLFLAIHSASYGSGFLADPAGMASEFGAYDSRSEAAENLTGLVGVLMLVMAAAAGLAAYWVLRFACREGAWLALALSVVALAVGVYWAFNGRTWDAGFYCVAGISLGSLAVWLLQEVKRGTMHDSEPL